MLRKNEIPSLCRLTLAKAEYVDGGEMFVVFITDNDKYPNKTTPYKFVGKSFTSSRNCAEANITDYPGTELKNGLYVWSDLRHFDNNTNINELPRWTKIK